jgi:hypothetical protein
VRQFLTDEQGQAMSADEPVLAPAALVTVWRDVVATIPNLYPDEYGKGYAKALAKAADQLDRSLAAQRAEAAEVRCPFDDDGEHDWRETPNGRYMCRWCGAIR